MDVERARSEPALARVVRSLKDRSIVVLTGAGLSTDSGIPDYRGPNAPARTPMTYTEFLSGHAARQRYWARSHLGWPRMGLAAPNGGHQALARLERHGVVRLLITQNVDGLHERSGSRRMCALHGCIADVVCLSCRRRTGRAALQRRLDQLNPGFAEVHPSAVARPDGDVELTATAGYRIPGCAGCGGVLKPDVVFFGENVPKDRVASCYAAVDAADALLVAGSSLTVMSGLRFVRHAHRRGIRVVIVNRGLTRGDPLATAKLEMGCTQFLTEFEQRVAAHQQLVPARFSSSESRDIVRSQPAAVSPALPAPSSW